MHATKNGFDIVAYLGVPLMSIFLAKNHGPPLDQRIINQLNLQILLSTDAKKSRFALKCQEGTAIRYIQSGPGIRFNDNFDSKNFQ